jgi:flagellar hook-associated protein 3 FlgL
MRVTAFTIFNQITRAFHENMRTMAKFSERLTTGKKINRPSEDATNMMEIMDYRVNIKELEQYKRNINDAKAHLGFAETALSSVINILTRARELAIEASTGTLNPDNRVAIAQEVANLRDELLSLANSKFRNRYIFAGFKTDTEAFDPSFNYQGDSGEINVIVDRGATIAVNIPGNIAFSYGGVTFMETLDDLVNALNNNDVTAIGNAITAIENALDQVINVQTDVGARLKYLDDLELALEDRDITLRTFLSESEDADIAETVSELAKAEIALQSLRQSSAQILSQSLLDFLR